MQFQKKFTRWKLSLSIPKKSRDQEGKFKNTLEGKLSHFENKKSRDHHYMVRRKML